ncbi:MAG: hypothetical protein MI757_01755 [Pirellulales bacterium]|nr:hypothetical protein [Pirellulales bacterium]
MSRPRPHALHSVCAFLALGAFTVAAQDGTRELAAALPKSATAFVDADLRQIDRPIRTVIDRVVSGAVFDRGEFGSPARAAGNVRMVDRITATKAQVDAILESTLAIRAQFAKLPEGAKRRKAIRNFLRTVSKLNDLSARLRYMLFDIVSEAALEVETQPQSREDLIAVLSRRKSSIGADALSVWLAPDSEYKPDIPTQYKLLQLFAAAREHDLIPVVANYVRNARVPGAVIYAAEVLEHLGVPQEPRPGADDSLPRPPITAEELWAIVRRVDTRDLSESLRARHNALIKSLGEMKDKGVTGNTYRLGAFSVKPGDWLLMRNPSPYNLFTDLSPGLYTHVGVITDEVASDGLRRIVLVDLPERGTSIPATPIDTYVQRTLNYIVLRHPDPKVAKQMADAARSVIGNESQFDLNFRTERLTPLKGKPLKGKKIHTYCAGLLLLCGQQTAEPRETFFPIPEFPAGGLTVKNLAELGLTFGDKFISPTGALFSEKMTVVGRKPSTYSPQREIEESVFDHFATGLIDRRLNPTVDLYKQLRLKVAETAKGNPLLARALAMAVEVSEATDLVAAAKAAAVVETLDEVAYAASREFTAARDAITAGPLDELAREGWKRDEIEQVRKLRARHADLSRRWEAYEISPRGLRIALVQYYAKQGRDNIDKRFYRAKP